MMLNVCGSLFNSHFLPRKLTILDKADLQWCLTLAKNVTNWMLLSPCSFHSLDALNSESWK